MLKKTSVKRKASRDCMKLTHNDANWIMVHGGLSQNKMINILGEIKRIFGRKSVELSKPVVCKLDLFGNLQIRYLGQVSSYLLQRPRQIH